MIVKYLLLGYALFLLSLLIMLIRGGRSRTRKEKEFKTPSERSLSNFYGKKDIDKNTERFLQILKKGLKYDAGELRVVQMGTRYFQERHRVRHTIEVATGTFPIDEKSLKICIIYDSPRQPLYILETGIPQKDSICDSQSIEILLNKAQVIINTWQSD